MPRQRVFNERRSRGIIGSRAQVGISSAVLAVRAVMTCPIESDGSAADYDKHGARMGIPSRAAARTYIDIRHCYIGDVLCLELDVESIGLRVDMKGVGGPPGHGFRHPIR